MIIHPVEYSADFTHRAGKRILLISLVLISLAAAIKPLAAGELTFDGQINERFEILNGMNKKAYGDRSIDAKGKISGNSDDRLLLQRIMAGIVYKQDEHISYHLQMYDARIWGWSLNKDNFLKNKGTSDEYVMDPNEEFFELHDAYLEDKDFVVDGFSLKLGRQEISYGDKRIFGPGDWGNSFGWLWDAVRFSCEKQDNFIDAWYGQTKTSDPFSFSMFHRHEYQGIGLYSHYKLTKNGAFEPFFAWKNSLFNDVTPEEKTYYYGARFYTEDLYGYNCDFTYAIENGDIGKKPVKSYGYVARVGYRFDNIFMKPNIVLGRVFAGGNSNPNSGYIRTFTRPFGSTDGEHYGRMDIMSWSNLVDNEINLYLEPIEKANLKLAYHNFFLDKPADAWSYYGYKNLPGNSYTHLGWELDFQLKYDYSDTLAFQLIYAHFNAGSFVTHNVEENDAHRLFLQCTYRFRFPLEG